jgi:hypothetical protein
MGIPPNERYMAMVHSAETNSIIFALLSVFFRRAKIAGKSANNKKEERI